MLHFGDVIFEPAEKKDHISYLVKFGNEGGLHKQKLSKRRTCVLEQEEGVDALHKQEDYFVFLVCAPDSKSKMGVCELYDISWIHKTCKLHLWLADRAEWIPVYGNKALNIALTYAFNTLGLNKVTADISNDDIIMSSLYKKHGFSQEVRKRNHFFSKGKYLSVIELSILADEFEIIA